MKKIAVCIGTAILISGCAYKTPTVEEQVAEQYDPAKGDVQMITIRQSHGLIPDLISGLIETVTGTN